MSLAEPVTLPAVLERTAAACGDREAFVAPGERLTWHQLRDESLRLAGALAQAGVRKGDHVGVLMGNCGAWVRAFYACATLGAVTVPINTRFRLDELGYCLKQADISTLIFIDRFLDIDFVSLLEQVEPALRSALPGKSAAEARARDHARRRPLPRRRAAARRGACGGDAVPARPKCCPDLLLIQYTSGTTSFPKGVMLTHRNMLQDAAAGRRSASASGPTIATSASAPTITSPARRCRCWCRSSRAAAC